MRSNMLVQQAQVMRGLHALSAQVLARVQQVRNAVAVRLDAVQMDAARPLPGVRAVRCALGGRHRAGTASLQDVALGKSRSLILNLPESLARNST